MTEIILTYYQKVRNQINTFEGQKINWNTPKNLGTKFIIYSRKNVRENNENLDLEQSNSKFKTFSKKKFQIKKVNMDRHDKTS